MRKYLAAAVLAATFAVAQSVPANAWTWGFDLLEQDGVFKLTTDGKSDVFLDVVIDGGSDGYMPFGISVFFGTASLPGAPLPNCMGPVDPSGEVCGSNYDVSFKGFETTAVAAGATETFDDIGILFWNGEQVPFGTYFVGFGLRDGPSGGMTNVVEVTVAPIPGAIWLFGAALSSLGFMGWRRRRVPA